MAKRRSQLASSRQWCYPVWQPWATAVSYPQLVPCPKIQMPARCGRQPRHLSSPIQADAGSHTTQLVAQQWQRRAPADRLSTGSCWCLPLPDKTSACLSSSFYSTGGCLAASTRGAEGCRAEPSSTPTLPHLCWKKVTGSTVSWWGPNEWLLLLSPHPCLLESSFPEEAEQQSLLTPCSRAEVQVTERQLGAAS